VETWLYEGGGRGLALEDDEKNQQQRRGGVHLRWIQQRSARSPARGTESTTCNGVGHRTGNIGNRLRSAGGDDDDGGRTHPENAARQQRILPGGYDGRTSSSQLELKGRQEAASRRRSTMITTWNDHEAGVTYCVPSAVRYKSLGRHSTDCWRKCR